MYSIALPLLLLLVALQAATLKAELETLRRTARRASAVTAAHMSAGVEAEATANRAAAAAEAEAEEAEAKAAQEREVLLALDGGGQYALPPPTPDELRQQELERSWKERAEKEEAFAPGTPSQEQHDSPFATPMPPDTPLPEHSESAAVAAQLRAEHAEREQKALQQQRQQAADAAAAAAAKTAAAQAQAAAAEEAAAQLRAEHAEREEMALQQQRQASAVATAAAAAAAMAAAASAKRALANAATAIHQAAHQQDFVEVTFAEAGPLLFALEAPRDKVGALVGRFTRAKAADGAALGAVGPVEASGRVARGDELVCIGDVDVAELPFKAVVSELRAAVQRGFPLTLRFKTDSARRERWKSPAKENRRPSHHGFSSRGALEPEQQRHLLQMLVAGGLFKKHGRRGAPKDRWVWLSEDLKVLQWRTPTGERKPRGTLPMNTLRGVLQGSFDGSADDEQPSALAVKGKAAAAGLTLRFQERDVDLQVCISETDTHNAQVRDEWMQAFRLMLAIHRKREKKKASQLSTTPRRQRQQQLTAQPERRRTSMQQLMTQQVGAE